MLKEICIMPEVFDNDHMDASNWKDVKQLLELIQHSGYILGLNNKDWINTTLTNISKLEPKLKDRFFNIFDTLKDRKRIVGHPKSSINPVNENDWLLIAEELNTIREFYAILATETSGKNILNMEQLEDMNISEKFGLTGSMHYLKTEDELEKIFLPLLSYAKKVTIIDPYFNISSKRYQDTIKYIAKAFMERRGNKGNGSIIIHCSSKILDNVNFGSWQNSIKSIFKEFGHIITINVWDRRTDSIKLHERYILTDQGGIVSGAGTDKDDYQQSEWTIKDYNGRIEILNQYIEGADVYDLKYIITGSSVIEK